MCCLQSPFDKNVLRQLSLAVAQVTKAGSATIKYTRVIDKVFAEFVKAVADYDVTVDKEVPSVCPSVCLFI